MKKKKKKIAPAEKKPSKALGIRGQLLLSFTAFVAVLLVIVWIFQIELMNRFYEQTRMNEFSAVSSAIESAMENGEEEPDEICYNLAVRYGVCIRVFACSGSSIRKELSSVDASQSCIIHRISPEILNNYYSNAVKNNGEWVTRIRIGEEPERFPDKEKEQNEDVPNSQFTPKTMAIRVCVFHATDGSEYAIFMNSEFTPMYTVTHTLKNLFWVLAAVLLITAAVMAYLFSRQISRPLAKMNEAAKKLANGQYETDFSIGGYRETRELGETLNYAAHEISRSDTLQRELIANISHDLRTPLTMVAGYAEIMRDIPNERTAENVQVIIDESRRLSDLVNDMLDLSRIRAGTKLPVITAFDLTETVSEVMQRYSVLIAHDGYKITFDADCAAIVRADRTMMLQVIYNLINNSVNYVGPDMTVSVVQTVNDGKVRITVSDRGEGIPGDEITNIWDRYYKVDRVHRRARIGTGLGLSIVRNILQLHGASFGVESAYGSGSSFWFELPIEPTETNETV